jgi:hypothetical protein
MSTFKVFVILFTVFLFFSCQEKTVPLPFDTEEAQSLAAQIRRNPLKPDKHILSLFNENPRVELVDFPGYTGVVELLEYMMPLLYDEGIREYDLWFIPPDGLKQVNAILNASRFFPQSAADIIGRVSYLYQFKEYVDFLEAVYNFNKSLPPESPPVTVVTDSSLPCLKLSRETAETSEIPLLYIQSPLLFESFISKNDPTALQKIKQVSLYLKGGENLYVIDDELRDSFLKEDISIIMLKQPGTLTLCTPFTGGINKENAAEALKDFPEISIKAAWAAVPLMKRAQKKFLKNIVP